MYINKTFVRVRHAHLKFITKGRLPVVMVTKQEKEQLLKLFPGVHIVRTMKQKSKRHRYYCAEECGVVEALQKMRNGSK